jgi:hypothetical protein
MTAEKEAKLNVLGFSWVKRQSPAGSNDDNNNVICPDEVTSESLPMKRQRTSDDIPNEVRSNDSSWRLGDYEGGTLSPAADGFKTRNVRYLEATINDEGSTSGQESLDAVNNSVGIKGFSQCPWGSWIPGSPSILGPNKKEA